MWTSINSMNVWWLSKTTLNLDMKGIDCVTLTPDTASELRKVPPWPVQYVKIEKKMNKDTSVLIILTRQHVLQAFHFLQKWPSSWTLLSRSWEWRGVHKSIWWLVKKSQSATSLVRRCASIYHLSVCPRWLQTCIWKTLIFSWYTWFVPSAFVEWICHRQQQ